MKVGIVSRNAQEHSIPNQYIQWKINVWVTLHAFIELHFQLDFLIFVWSAELNI